MGVSANFFNDVNKELWSQIFIASVSFWFNLIFLVFVRLGVVEMGKKQSKMDPHQLIHLLNRTKFEEKELEKWYQKFIKEYPDGFISKPQFENMYQSFFPKGDAREFADHIFRTFDGNSDGKIGKLV